MREFSLFLGEPRHDRLSDELRTPDRARLLVLRDEVVTHLWYGRKRIRKDGSSPAEDVGNDWQLYDYYTTDGTFGYSWPNDTLRTREPMSLVSFPVDDPTNRTTHFSEAPEQPRLYWGRGYRFAKPGESFVAFGHKWPDDLIVEGGRGKVTSVRPYTSADSVERPVLDDQTACLNDVQLGHQDEVICVRPGMEKPFVALPKVDEPYNWVTRAGNALFWIQDQTLYYKDFQP